MVWKIEFDERAEKELNKLDKQIAIRLLKFLHAKLADIDNPRALGSSLKGNRFGEYWKYRIGDYRIITRIEDKVMVILVIRVGHRKEVYS